MAILDYKGYQGTAEIDLEQGICHGRLLFVIDVVTYVAKDVAGLKKEFEAAVDDYLETCKELGRAPEKPLSGTFNVRVDPEIHRAAKVRAMHDKTSLNQVVERSLACFLHGADSVTTNNYYVIGGEGASIRANITNDTTPGSRAYAIN